ncbi:MAG: glycosyltransferase [Patescibacteria group bacterium]
MKLILTKIGKAFCAIKRDGVYRGGKRVLRAFFSTLRFVGSGDVLIITGGVGDSARYRAWHYAEELNLNGIKTAVAYQDNPFLARYSAKFKVFIFHRTLYTGKVKKLIEKIKEQNKEIIFETDDLVYDPEFLKYMDYYKNMNFLEKKLYENGVGGEILDDDYVKVCTTTTTFLAKKLKEKGKQVFLVPNKLCKQDIEWTEEILKGKKKENKDEIIIGYFSGTISHNKDFATIEKPLEEIMKKHPQTKLFLAGPLDINHNLVKKFGDRIINTPYVPRKEHFKNIAKVDINISPLEKDNPFCESKSELKFFEAGALKIPTVATATQTFSEAIKDGIDGFVAKDSKEWTNKLEKIIINKELREKIGEKAYEKTLRDYTTENSQNKEYYAYLKKQIQQQSNG